MSREAYIRAAVAMAASRLLPSTVREAVISDVKFTQRFALKADAIIRFGRDDIAFQRSSLFGAIRQAFQPGYAPTSVESTRGETWQVRVSPEKSPVEISLSQGPVRLMVSHFGLLCPDKATRFATLLHEADNFGLSSEQIAGWRELLEERQPTDDEVVIIQDDIKDTPIAVAGIIRESLASGSASLDAWVPRSARYYERLVGRWENGLLLEDYATQVAPRQFGEVLQWHGAEGLKQALLIAPQGYLSTALAERLTDDDALAEVLIWLGEKGDAMSCAAGIEIAQPRIARDDRLKEPLSRILKALVVPKFDLKVDQFQLLSCVFLAVYGEMAHCRVHADKPPFWRKLAALAQTSLITRCIIDIGGDASELASWLQRVRSQMYLLQCFADLRAEPRWLPDFGLPRQMGNEICGRVWAAVGKLPPDGLEPELAELISGDHEGSLKQKFNHFQACLPGPLEGGIAAVAELPLDEVTRIEGALSSDRITAESISGLANAAIVFRYPSELTDMAADAIARADYRLLEAENKSFIPYLLGLASASAVTRGVRLADALFILLRTYRHFHPEEVTIDDAFRIAMIACASRAELMDWCKCVGDFMTDCAFQPITSDEAARMHSHLVHLCHLVPELWSSCGQAEAAFRSVLRA
jgi:hypothetical protein